MKKKLAFMTVAALLSVQAMAYDFPGFEWSVGMDVTTNYLWRGMNYGAFAIQPDVSLGYGGLTAEVWANLSPSNYTKEDFKNWENWTPELDFTLKYNIAGLTIGATQFYYFDGSKFLDFKGSDYEAYQNDEQSSTQTEVFAEFNLGEIVEKAPLHLGWYTYVGGDDKYAAVDDEGNLLLDADGKPYMKRAYSSYCDVSYRFDLPLGFSLTPAFGFTPWKGCYNYYEGNLSINNINLRADWDGEFGDYFSMNVYAQIMMNTYGVTKDNLIPAVQDCYNNQRLNFSVGVGIYLGN